MGKSDLKEGGGNNFMFFRSIGRRVKVTANLGSKNEQTYVSLEDEQLISLIHEGDNDALAYLIQKYRSFVRAKARAYFLIGADREDIIQEGMIGLYNAVQYFRPERLVSFRAFADLCVTRQMITAIKAATRQKHTPLNTYISLDKPMYAEEPNRTLLDVLSSVSDSDPAERLINEEKTREIEKKLASLLSNLEKEVLALYLEGCSYREISKQLNRKERSIDNALQRVKKKLEQHVDIKKLI